jgi:hypothetical protein
MYFPKSESGKSATLAVGPLPLSIVSIGDVVKNRLEEIEGEASSMREFIAGA